MTVGSGDPFDYDAELSLYNEHLRAAARVGPRDHVLDIGCGAGLTTRQAARAATDGSATGVDISSQMIDRARRLSAEEELDNVAFVQADAQAHPFRRHRFDLSISRFGTMFFADPVTAFTNIALSLRAGGRLAMLVWQGRDVNEWVAAIGQPGVVPGPDTGPGMFSLADPVVTTAVLEAAGFADVVLADVREPVYQGPDTASALAAVTSLWADRELKTLNADAAADAVASLEAYLDAHRRDAGVFLDSAAWLVTART